MSSVSKQQTETIKQYQHSIEKFHKRIEELGLRNVENYYWYHSIDLGDGLVTPGFYDFRDTIHQFHFPENMEGMAVLDVGSATGYFAFEFEKRGARVTSVELPSLAALDRFPGQTVEQAVSKLERMIHPAAESSAEPSLGGDELYLRLLKGPFEFCREYLHSEVKRCLSTVYDLPEARLETSGFDLIFMGDILLHALYPLRALAAVAPLCSGTLILSQTIPEGATNQAAMVYVGGEDPIDDEISWWWPNQLCLTQLLKKLGFRQVKEVSRISTLYRPGAHVSERTVLHAVK